MCSRPIRTLRSTNLIRIQQQKCSLFPSVFVLPHPRWHMIWTPAPFDLVGMLVDIGPPETVEVYRCQESYKTCQGRRSGFKDHAISKLVNIFLPLASPREGCFLLNLPGLRLNIPIHTIHTIRTCDVKEGHRCKARNMRPGRGIFLLKGLAVEQGSKGKIERSLHIYMPHLFYRMT